MHRRRRSTAVLEGISPMRPNWKTKSRTPNKRRAESCAIPSGANRDDDGANCISQPALNQIPDEDIRSLAVKMTGRMSIDRFVRLMASVAAALRADDISRAERVAALCRLNPCREFIDRVLTLARSGKNIDAVTAVFKAELFAYENSLDHLWAFLEYEERIGARPPAK